MRATIKEIAQRAGVSLSTVSNVLNNKNGTIKAGIETRNNICKIACELNYSPNIAAQGLREGRTYMVAVAIDKIINSFVPEILQGIEDIFHENSINMILCSYDTPDSFDLRVERLRRRSIDGLLMLPHAEPAYIPIYTELARKNLPMVFFCGYSVMPGIPGVYVDEEKIGSMAAEYLVKLGHKKIMVIPGRNKKCIASFDKILAENGIAAYKDMTFGDLKSFEDGRKAIKYIIEKRISITAAFAYADITAAGMIYEAHEQGIKVPEELSILGIDDLPICTMVNPNITTIAQPKYEIGAIAARLLLEIIGGDKKSMMQDAVLEPFLIERQSCCSKN